MMRLMWGSTARAARGLWAAWGSASTRGRLKAALGVVTALAAVVATVFGAVSWREARVPDAQAGRGVTDSDQLNIASRGLDLQERTAVADSASDAGQVVFNFDDVADGSDHILMTFEVSNGSRRPMTDLVFLADPLPTKSEPVYYYQAPSVSACRTVTFVERVPMYRLDAAAAVTWTDAAGDRWQIAPGSSQAFRAVGPTSTPDMRPSTWLETPYTKALCRS